MVVAKPQSRLDAVKPAAEIANNSRVPNARDKIERDDEDKQEWHSRKILLGLRLCETNPPWRS